MLKFKNITNENKQKNKGFTLVELIVAICIVGVLVAFLVPSFVSKQSEAKVEYDRTKAESIAIYLKRATAEEEVIHELDKWFSSAAAGSTRIITIEFEIDEKGKTIVRDATVDANGSSYPFETSKLGLNSYQGIGNEIQFKNPENFGKTLTFTLTPKTTKETATCSFAFA